jgi:hypothetical protein
MLSKPFLPQKKTFNQIVVVLKKLIKQREHRYIKENRITSSVPCNGGNKETPLNIDEIIGMLQPIAWIDVFSAQRTKNEKR